MDGPEDLGRAAFRAGLKKYPGDDVALQAILHGEDSPRRAVATIRAWLRGWSYERAAAFVEKQRRR